MKGFSLIEIMVTVAIIAIMASSVVIGFNSFGDTVRTQETAGVITDTIKNLELEMIRRDYVKQTVNFDADYLVIEAEVENQTLELTWNEQGGCAADEEELGITNETGSPIYLAQRDEYGNNMQIEPKTETGTVCVAFKDSEDTEWQYQLFNGGDRSQIIRFKHFNVRRGSQFDPVQIVSGTDYSLEITAPYASKTFLDSGAPTSDTATLQVQNGGDPVTITLQE